MFNYVDEPILIPVADEDVPQEVWDDLEEFKKLGPADITVYDARMLHVMLALLP